MASATLNVHQFREKVDDVTSSIKNENIRTFCPPRSYLGPRIDENKMSQKLDEKNSQRFSTVSNF